ncbi:MAG: 6-carboxytetrahydropterin synthase QueD [Victivallales bacterium]|nr:6-carboxytetrahydropterin synthase QueD [Victivallales bacterium]
MYEIDIKREFSAAHCLKGYKGNCSELHGHNWTVQAFVSAKELDDVGMAIDFRILKRELDSIVSELDHKNLNTLHIFSAANPSSEFLAKHIFDRLSEKIVSGRLSVEKVRVCESGDAGATYFKDPE